MKTLWFKQKYVDDIYAGIKTNTVRINSSRTPNEGDIVNFSVGPRKPFARAIITKKVNAASLSERKKRELLICYDGKLPNNLVQIDFLLTDIFK